MTMNHKMAGWLSVPGLLALVLTLLWVSAAWAEIQGFGAAINKAGRQRMLTQRIVKAYSMVGMDVQSRLYRRQLDDAVALFDSQLVELKAFAPTAQIADGLDQVQTLWGPFKALATGNVSREGAQRLLASNDELLAAAHRVVVMLEQAAGSSVGQLVNMAGRQRMLSQRFAKFYMLRAWGFDDPSVAEGMSSAGSEFEGALRILKTAPENTPPISAELEKAGRQWYLVKQGLKMEKGGQYIPSLIGSTTENLLKTMNNITGMYEALGNG